MTILIEHDENAGTLRMSNGFLMREFDISRGCRTTRYEYKGVSGNLIAEWAPSPESIFWINGSELRVGSDSFKYESHDAVRAADGDTCLNIHVRGQGSHGIENTEIIVHYEMNPEVPYLVKWLTVRNCGNSSGLVVDGVCPEVLFMPMPHGVLRTVQPTQFQKYTLQFSNLNTTRYRFCDKNMSSPANSPVFIMDRHSRKMSTGFSILTDYVNILEWPVPCCNEGGGIIECRGRDTPSTILTRYGLGPDVELGPSEEFTSFKTYESFFEGGYDDACLAFKRMLRERCPWLKKTYVSVKSVSGRTLESLRSAADMVADVGCEKFRFGQTIFPRQDGHFTLNKDLFPSGLHQARELVNYVHGKGLIADCYVPMMWALWHMDETDLFQKNNWYLEMPDGKAYAEDRFAGAVKDAKPLHNTACLASGYGDYVTTRLKEIVVKLGLDGLCTDGPYDGFVCYSERHRHRSPANSQFQQWEVQRRFYMEMAAAGIHIFSPQALCAILHGNTGTCCGFECWMSSECESTRMNEMVSVWEQIVSARQDLWVTSHLLPPAAMRHALSSWNYGDTGDEEALDHWFATVIGYGLAHISLKLTENHKALFGKWIGFFKKYRTILESDIIHLYPPTGTGIDAIMHVNPDSDPCGMIVVYNPTSLPLKQTMCVPFRYFEDVPGVRLVDLSGKPVDYRIESDWQAAGLMEGERITGPEAVFEVTLAPREIRWIEVRQGRINDATGLDRKRVTGSRELS